MLLYQWQGQKFWLNANRIIFWENENTLIASDLHIGKTGHFRKNGIGIPQDIFKEDMQRLFAALQYYNPQRILLVGDLFHSLANKELDWFARWRAQFCHIVFVLVKGNHDILPPIWYQQNEIIVVENHIENRLLFIHDQADSGQAPLALNGIKATVSGHLHPSVSVPVGPKQQVNLPCYYFSEKACILPAYSHFTGTHQIRPQKNDAVFVITGQEVIRL